MRHLLFIAFAAIFFISCNKNIESENSESAYTKKIKLGLKENLNKNDLESLDLAKSIITKAGDGKIFLRIPIKEKEISKDFVLIQTDASGLILKGLMINLNKDTSVKGKEYQYNGVIKITSLNRSSTSTSQIVNGYITSLHPNNTQQKGLNEAEMLPEVTVTCYISGGGMSYSDYIFLGGLFGSNDGNSGYYSPINYSGGGGGAGGDGGGGDTGDEKEEYLADKTILIDYESPNNPTIDLQKILKCFANIPDYGSTCSIEILVDIPVDEDPNLLFNFKQGSVGHTFLEITKTNGGQSVTQYIGFYPTNTWKMLLTEPAEGKFVDNGEHEYNAGLKMNITPEQLNNTLNYLNNSTQYLYDIDDYNCTDLALEVFNQSRIGNLLKFKNFRYRVAEMKIQVLQGLYITG